MDNEIAGAMSTAKWWLIGILVAAGIAATFVVYRKFYCGIVFDWIGVLNVISTTSALAGIVTGYIFQAAQIEMAVRDRKNN